jgi:CRISPR/Cas system CSM-associated protein Csm4 (group 5 of RAMP superfamily)
VQQNLRLEQEKAQALADKDIAIINSDRLELLNNRIMRRNEDLVNENIAQRDRIHDLNQIIINQQDQIDKKDKIIEIQGTRIESLESDFEKFQKMMQDQFSSQARVNRRMTNELKKISKRKRNKKSSSSDESSDSSTEKKSISSGKSSDSSIVDHEDDEDEETIVT